MNHVRHGYSSNLERARYEAYALQTELGWGKDTTFKELEKFTDMYPNWRLAVLQVAFPRSEMVFSGKDFSFNQDQENQQVEHKQKDNVVYLVYDPVNQHFGLISSPKEMYKTYLHRHDIKFCEVCVEVFTELQEHECDRNPYSKPTKPPCDNCGRYGKHPCSQTCKAVYGRGTKNAYVSHRCIVYKEPSKKEFMKPDDPLDGTKYGQFVYDCESRIETVTTKKCYISDFATTNGKFTDGENVPVGCESDSLVTTILRHANKIEKHIVNLICMENCITGQKYTYEGIDCIKEFLTFLKSYNHGRY